MTKGDEGFLFQVVGDIFIFLNVVEGRQSIRKCLSILGTLRHKKNKDK